MLYGYPIKNVSVFDCQEDCRESFEKSLLERLYKAYKNNSSKRFPKGGYTYTEKEYIPPIDAAAVRKNMRKISEGIKILDMLNRWLKDK